MSYTLFQYVYNKTGSDQTASLYRYCTSFEINTKLEKLLPIIEDAEREYLVPVLGEAFYQELVTAAHAESPTAAELAALAVCRRASAWFAFTQAILDLSIQVGAMGPGEPVDKDGAFPFSRKWVTEAAKRQAFRNGLQRLEEAGQFLENNAATYPSWKNSEAYTIRKELFIPSPTVLNEYIPCNRCSRAVYTRLRPLIEQAEIRYIRPVMGESFYDEIKLYLITEDSYSSDHVELLGQIRKALSLWLQQKALAAARLRIDETGLIEPKLDEMGYNSPASEQAVTGLWFESRQEARLFTQELKNYLDSKADVFTTYADSKTPAGEPSQDNDNGTPSSIVSFL